MSHTLGSFTEGKRGESVTTELDNRLQESISPYLREHASNPVAWQPWDDEALEAARASDRTILLSIGYSACHWCHVMARESFSDSHTAHVMNREFVNIKVDREERPDLDRVYQLAFQALHGRGGGWPLTVFLTPDDLTPFFAGTYFPPLSAHGMPAFVDVLERIAGVWRDQREAVRKQNAKLQELFDSLGPTAAAALSHEPVEGAVGAMERVFDTEHGGFGDAPKFPHPGPLRLALERSVGDSADAARAQLIAEHTLARMQVGGMFDQIGGGFARYSVDTRWEIPHFEKMLSDNGLLLGLYADAAVAYGREDFAATARATAEWMLREMQLSEGGLCASLDADSEGEEGRFYVWSTDEITAALDGFDDLETDLVRRRFGLDRGPNFEGRWHPVAAVDPATLAHEFELDEGDVNERVERGRAALLEARERRERPHRDDKVLTAWNALAAEGLAIAGRRLDEQRYVEAALACLDFLRAQSYSGDRLQAVWREGVCRQPAFLDDHAALLSALVATLQAHWREADLAWARELAETLLDRFTDSESGGFFQTADDHEALPYRPKPLADDPTPSGNGLAALALEQAGHLLADNRYLEVARGALIAVMGDIERDPVAHATLVRALAAEFAPPEVILLQGEPDSVRAIMARAAATFRPNRLVLAASPAAGLALPEAPAGGIVARRCRGTACDAPETDHPDAIAQMVAR